MPRWLEPPGPAPESCGWVQQAATPGPCGLGSQQVPGPAVSQSRVAEEGGAEGADKKEEGFTVKWPVSQMKTGKPVPCFIMYGLQVTIDCPH